MSQNNVEGFRLSPQQRHVWSLQQVSAFPIYQVLSTISIKGDLSAEILERAFADVVRRHEILRTTFQRPSGIKIPFQVISDAARLSLQFSDLSNLDHERQRSQLEQSFAAESGRSFDFDRGPLLRANLFKLSREEHLLLISLPALCGDSVTVLNLMSELGRAYSLILQGGVFLDEPMQYADFAEWQNELLQGSEEHAEQGLNFWNELKRGLSPLSLPLEKRKTTDQTFHPEAVSIDFDSSFVAGVDALAHECETSTEVVLFACCQAIVSRLTNQSHFVIFNLFDGRKLEDLKSAFGVYAKYLPVACRSEDISFASQVLATRAALSDAEEWQEYFDPNDFSEASTDSIAFDFTEQVSTLENAGLEFSLTRQDVHLGSFKLRLSCFRAEGSIRAELVYDAHSLDRETVERYAGYFRRLTAQASVSASIEQIEIVGETERKRLLADINQTASEFVEANCIHELFEEQVARTPEAIALVCDDLELTYAELNAEANRLAHLLRRRGLVSNPCVGICLERSAEAIIALLGILKAGGAYVPLNPEHPTARLALQLAESNASFLITGDTASNELLEFGGEIIDLKRDRELLLAEPDINPSSIDTPAALAYVIYTSGSSGIPKGVAVSHQALVNYTQFILGRLHVKQALHFASVSTITADLGNTCIFPALVSGGCLHLISYDVAMEPALFSKYLTERPIDVLKIVPSHLNALLGSEPRPDILPGKHLILGGEALSWELVDRISKTNSTCEIINHYGPTETTVGSLTFKIKPHEVPTQSLTVPIGKPIANTHVYILDPHLKLTPTGVAGELYIGGAGLAAGYLNQPIETAVHFIPNPFSDERGGRLYRTGDLTRYLPDGNIEFLGRIDHQVKVRGFRVELAEIESVLLKHSQVRQAVVTAEPATADNQRLLGYVVASGSKTVGVDALRTFLGQHLPDYMIPSTFIFLKAMPLTSNGKIDRASLPAPDESRPDLQRLFVAPRTAVERELAGIWAEFLKLDEVGVEDNFFELGGHSLLATQVVARMRKAFNCEIRLRSLFELPTIAQLAEQIGDSTASETERLLAEIEKLSDEEVEVLLKTKQR
jgi:amino acid adenylation domain-containing protein